MDSSVLMAERGSYLGSRETGKQVREKIETFLSEGHEVSLDFAGVDMVTQSFADEVVGPLFRQQGQDVLKRVHFLHCNDNVKEVLNFFAAYSLSD